MIYLIISFYIKGFVKDKGSGEPLPYADVYLEGTNKGTYTDEKGYFYIGGVKRGRYKLVVSYIGYEEWRRDLDVDDNLTVIVELEEKPILLPEVKVSAERERFRKEVEVSRTYITGRELNIIPSFLESDLLRSIQSLPGVITFHDLSNKLYVRGGTPDENLMYLDGITVYNPTSHLFGLFSTFNSDAVRDVEVYTGAYPARYGDRLSSVVDVETRTGNTKRLSSTLSLSLISTRVLLEGPIWRSLSYLISYRRTYFDIITFLYSKIMDTDIRLPYYFYDFISKFNILPDIRSEVNVTFYGSDDVIKFEEKVEDYENKVDISWGNRGVSMRGSRFLTDRLFVGSVVAYSKFHTDLNAIIKNEESEYDTISIYQFITDYTFKTDLKYEFLDDQTLLTGFDAKYISMVEGERVSYIDTMISHDSTGFLLLPLYSEVRSRIGRFIFNPGIRTIYSSALKRFYTAPRFGVKYLFNEDLALHSGLGVYHQFIYTINSQESFFSIYDIWKPVDEGEVPMAYHAVLGVEKLLNNGRFKVEVYYKEYKNLRIPTVYNFIFSMPSDSFYYGDGYAYGLEVFYKFGYKGWNGWVGYTFGYTERRYDGKSYNPPYDRRHTLNITVSKIFGKNSITLRWNFGTGLPTGGIVGMYERYRYYPESDSMDKEWVIVRGERDAIRLPPSHRLDLHYERMTSLFKKPLIFFADVINLYAHKNIVFYYNYMDEEGKVRWEGVSFLPIAVITFGVRLKI